MFSRSRVRYRINWIRSKMPRLPMPKSAWRLANSVNYTRSWFTRSRSSGESTMESCEVCYRRAVPSGVMATGGGLAPDRHTIAGLMLAIAIHENLTSYNDVPDACGVMDWVFEGSQVAYEFRVKYDHICALATGDQAVSSNSKGARGEAAHFPYRFFES